MYALQSILLINRLTTDQVQELSDNANSKTGETAAKVEAEFEVEAEIEAEVEADEAVIMRASTKEIIFPKHGQQNVRENWGETEKRERERESVSEREQWKGSWSVWESGNA